MPTTQVTFRMEEQLKKQAETLFDEMGINMTTALNAFIKAAVREGKMPFELISDDYAFKMKIREKLEESLSESLKPNAKWLNQDEVFEKYREKYNYEL